MLPVRITEKELIVYGPQVEEIARHALLPATVKGQRVVHKEHRPVEDARRRQAQLEERFAELGEPGCRFLEGLSGFSVTARTRRSGCWPCWGPTPERT